MIAGLLFVCVLFSNPRPMSNVQCPMSMVHGPWKSCFMTETEREREGAWPDLVVQRTKKASLFSSKDKKRTRTIGMNRQDMVKGFFFYLNVNL